jgi:hypothetical protein
MTDYITIGLGLVLARIAALYRCDPQAQARRRWQVCGQKNPFERRSLRKISDELKDAGYLTWPAVQSEQR